MALSTRGNRVAMASDPTEQGLATSYFPVIGVNMNISQGAAVKPVHTAIPTIFSLEVAELLKKRRK